jgi:hypothetical protein
MKQSIRAAFRRHFAEPDRMAGVVAPDARDDRDPAGNRLDSASDGGDVLVVRHGGSFSGGACYNDGVGLVLDVKFAQGGQFLIIDPIPCKRGDKRDPGSCKYRLFHFRVLLMIRSGDRTACGLDCNTRGIPPHPAFLRRGPEKERKDGTIISFPVHDRQLSV